MSRFHFVYEKLDKLFHVYTSLPNSKMGFAFMIALWLILMALAGGGSYASILYMQRIALSCQLRKSMVNLLDSWIEKPSSDRFEHFLSLDAERFKSLLLRELARLDTEEAKAAVSLSCLIVWLLIQFISL